MMPGQQDGDTILPEGVQPPKEKQDFPLLKDTVDEHFFDTMGIAIVRGRGFRASDTASTPKVAVINEVVAKKYWPNQDPVGKRFRLGDAKGPWVQVAGVAKTSKYIWVAEPPLEYLYVPFAQNPRPRMMLLAGSAGDAASIVAPLREMIRGIDPNQPIYGARTMEDFYQQRAVDTPNLIVGTVGVLGVMGLALAMVGLYGIVAYSVSRRTREFGIRMAIGASSGNVLRIVLRQGLILSLTGIVIGLGLSIAAGRVVLFLFSSARSDVMAYVIVPPVLLAITMLAAYAPALRASRVNPIKALRYE
jgi:predicted permease